MCRTHRAIDVKEESACDAPKSDARDAVRNHLRHLPSGLVDGFLSEEEAFWQAGEQIALAEELGFDVAWAVRNAEIMNSLRLFSREVLPRFRPQREDFAAGSAQHVAEVIEEALHAEPPRLRWPAGPDAAALINGRAALTDEQWIDFGLPVTEEEFAANFRKQFGVDCD
jgi:hypothetical protein